MARIERTQVIAGIARQVEWWVEQRMAKLRDGALGTMAINPFLAPILFDFHSASDFGDLGDLLLDAHLMQGHATGFGKLVDERILPLVFRTTKLSPSYRRTNPILLESPYDEIDHIVPGANGSQYLLSLKASRWTIQLAMSVNLNRQFAEIRNRHRQHWNGVVVGVFYGNADTLTDKYDILRGINRGANHDVVDLTDFVKVHAGREFWNWLNDDAATQEWVIDGILIGLRESSCRQQCEELMQRYRAEFARYHAAFIRSDGSIDWHALLFSINE